MHDTLEREGWDVEIADAQNMKGLAPLVPAIWLPDPRIREEHELARFRLRLVKHKSALKNRVHSTLINFGKPRWLNLTRVNRVEDRHIDHANDRRPVTG